MSNTDLAWAAGIMDGEGTIGLKKRYRKEKNVTTYHVRTAVEVTDKQMIDKLYSIFNCGSLHIRDRVGNNKRHYSWICGSRDTEYVLKQIIRYLVTKKERAKYMLEYLGRLTTHHEHGMGSKHLPAAEIQQREFFFNLLHILNKRGV